MGSKSSRISLGLSWAYLGSQVGPRAPRQPQDGPKMAQDGPKTAPRRPKMAQDGPKTAPRRPQDGPKTAPRAPRRPQDGPRRPQDGPKTAPRAPRQPQDGPKMAQDGPKMAPRRPQDGSLISWALSGLKATKKQAKSKHLRWSTSVSVRFFAPLRRFPLLRNKFWGAAACPPQAFSIRPLPGFSLGAVRRFFCLTRLSQSVLVCLKTSESLPGPLRIPPALLSLATSGYLEGPKWGPKLA